MWCPYSRRLTKGSKMHCLIFQASLFPCATLCSTQSKKEKLQAEWNNLKFKPVEWKSKDEFKTARTTTTPTERVLQRLITMKETYSQLYPMLFKIAEVCSTMPVSNSWPERGVGKLRSVKTMAGRL